MIAIDFYETISIDDARGLANFLERRHEKGANSFYLHPPDKNYPLLQILVLRDLACAHYYDNEAAEGIVSRGAAHELDPNL